VKPYLKNIALLAVSTMICLGIVEIALRVAGFSHPRFFQPDKSVGAIFRPGTEGWWRSEGNVFVKINDAGFRDLPRTLHKPEDTVRIAVLGDSYAAAMQVDLPETFWNRLEKLLGRCAYLEDSNVEILNFGVSGHGTMQELLMFRHFARHYSPDLVLLAFSSGNDVRNNSKVLERARARPFPVLESGSLTEDMSFVDSPRFQRLSSTTYRIWSGLGDYRTAQALSFMIRSFRIRTVSNAEGAAADQAGNELGINYEVYVEPGAGEWEDAWILTEAVLDQLKTEVEATGANLLLASLSNGIQVHPDPMIREEYSSRIGVDDLFYPDRRVETIAKVLEIPYVLTAFDLAKIAQRENIYIHGFDNARLGFGHWNENGHDWGARLIAPAVCQTFADGSATAEPLSASTYK